MYRDIDAIAMLVEDLYHLLVAVALRHAHQTAELTDAMIHMHYIVAYLELLDLFQRQGHLATTRLVALEVVLMETVEYLVVCKEADAQVIIGKALMKRLIYRRKDESLILRLKDLLQTFVLFLAIGKDIDLVAL